MLAPGAAWAVWRVLVDHCHADDSDDSAIRPQFMTYVTRPLDRHEFRFGGSLGFGGKFRMTHGRCWRVDCYPEDRTPETEAMVGAANAVLSEMEARHGAG